MTHRNRAAQQETEKRHIKQFLRHIGIADNADFGDEPDAVLVIDGRRVGLEHRELTEEVLARNEPTFKVLEIELRNALMALGIRGGYSVGVGLRADAASWSKRSLARELAARIARVAFEQAAALSLDEAVTLDAPALVRHGFVDLLCMTVTRFPPGDCGDVPDAFVTPGYAGPVTSSVRAAVRAKERRLPTYKGVEALDAVWLLLVTGDSWVQATNSVATEGFQIASNFDAVYLMDTRTDQLQRLDTGPRSCPGKPPRT